MIDTLKENPGEFEPQQSFPQMILENLKIAGVQQAHKENRITFTSLVPWPGELVCAEGKYRQDEPDSQDTKPLHTTDTGHPSHPVAPVDPVEKRAAIFIGPEFGTVQRGDLVQAAREAGDAGFDVLIACVQLRGSYHRVQQTWPRPGAQGPHERRPAHGRRPQEHRQGQPVRDLR